MTYQNNQVSWWNQLLSYFSGYPVWLVEGGFGVVIGFLFGFIMKNFGKAFFYAFVTLVVANYVLSYFGLLEFHFDQLQKMVGIVEIPTIDVAFANLTSWMRQHIALCLGSLIGFTFGWKLGN